MQHAREQVVVGADPADMDDTASREVLAEDLNDLHERVLLERLEHFVDDDPGRRMQHGARKAQRLLFVLAQVALPASGCIQQRDQAPETQATERISECACREFVQVHRIGKDFTQSAGRQIRGARHIQQQFALRA